MIFFKIPLLSLLYRRVETKAHFSLLAVKWFASILLLQIIGCGVLPKPPSPC